MYFGVLTMTILAVVLSVLKGMSAILIADALDSLIKPISLITLTVLFIYLGINKNNIILAFITSNIIITIIITTIILLTIASRSYSKKIVRIEKILTIRDCISFIAIGLMTYSFFQLDTLILSMFRDQVVVGAYNMACNFVRLVIFIPMIVISRAQPSIAHAHSNGNTRKVLSITKTSILQSGICALIAAFLLIFFGETILAFVSEKYRSQHTALSILAIAHLFNAFIIIISGVLLMCKQQKIVLASQALGLVICLPLYFITIPLYGTIGASATVATALAATLISMIYLTRNWMRNFKQ
ncbi:MAG: hypothetical protein EOO92_21400 [Pedobacter sp.]|nr:MAG: hypothetical protein EOO92_21400 [Pedobacter sp.]